MYKYLINYIYAILFFIEVQKNDRNLRKHIFFIQYLSLKILFYYKIFEEMNLNERQQEAVNIIEWPLLIIAGAGSWKTATLTQRVGEMILRHNIAPRNILCVTFTNKAAREMKERIAHKLGIDIEGSNFRNSWRLPYIGTFHSFWVQTIKEVVTLKKSGLSESPDLEDLDIWIKKDFIIYDSSDSLSLLKQILKEKNIEDKEFPARKIQTYISNAKNNLISPQAYESLVDSRFKEVVKDIYYIYQIVKRKQCYRLRWYSRKNPSGSQISKISWNLPRTLSIYNGWWVPRYQRTSIPNSKTLGRKI